MRIPTQEKPRARQQISNHKSYPAPVGGLNGRDAIANMKPTDALALTNWYPRTAYVEIRGGMDEYATGMTGNGKTLMVYNAIGGTSKLFCATASGTYDVSSSGAVGASVASRTDGKHNWTMFGDGTSNWLIACNGVDKPLYYDGSTWTAVDGTTTPALTGVTTTNLIAPAIHKGRLMFIEKNTLSFWYLTAGAAGGALTEFPLDGVAQMGGYLMAMASWSVDAGSGPDDRMVFVTSEGEVIVYQGTNPNSANTWALVGVYRIGAPLGRRCMAKVGSDLIILTQNGAFSLTSIFTDSGVNYDNAISNKIENIFNEQARLYGSTFGWKAMLYPTQAAFIVNVPEAEDGAHVQYVMNTITKSWCKFTSWDAEDFAIFNDQLYYCDGTSTYIAWYGTSDNGANIEAYAKSAFTNFNIPEQKRVNLFKPVLAVNGSLSFLIDLDIDFNDAEITGVANYTAPSPSTWDSATWDSSLWGAGLQVIQEWQSPSEWLGTYVAGKIKVATNTLTVQWMSTDYVFEPGGIL